MLKSSFRPASLAKVLSPTNADSSKALSSGAAHVHPSLVPICLIPPSSTDSPCEVNDQQVDQRPVLRRDGQAAMAPRVWRVSSLMLVADVSFETVAVTKSTRSGVFTM